MAKASINSASPALSIGSSSSIAICRLRGSSAAMASSLKCGSRAVLKRAWSGGSIPLGMATCREALLYVAGSSSTRTTSAWRNSDQLMNSLCATGQLSRISSYARRWSASTDGSRGIQWVQVLSGELQMATAEQEYHMPAGSLLVLRPGIRHDV